MKIWLSVGKTAKMTIPALLSCACVFLANGSANAASAPCPNESVRSGASMALPDCRAYEMVSPIDKQGGSILTLGAGAFFRARYDQSAESGEAITYSAVSPFAGAAAAAWSNQYLSRRAPSGWQTESVTPPQNGPEIGETARALDTRFRYFSPELDSGWLENQNGPPLDPQVPYNFLDIFRRDNLIGGYESAIPTLPPFSEALGDEGFPELQGVSRDGGNAVLRVRDQLTPEAAPFNGAFQVYESTVGAPLAERLNVVSRLPNGQPTEEGASVGLAETAPLTNRTANLTRAISEDGERVYWTAAESGAGPLYLRVNATQPQSAVVGGACTETSRACTVAVSAGPAFFQAASADGARALYSEPGNRELFDFELASSESRRVAGEIRGLILGSGESLDNFYFVSEEAIAGAPESGVPNLYADTDGTLTYIATLAALDAEGISQALSPVNRRPFWHAAAVSPDGQTLVFSSVSHALAERVGSFDNTNPETGEPAAEIYRYRSTTGELACISCNLLGTKPSANLLAEYSSPGERIPVAAMLPATDSSLYQPNAVTRNGGRVFFNSFDALVRQDTNSVEDGYEWEALGSGSCTEAGADFSALTKGCISLVSSGRSSATSEILDADPEGRNVFFTTSGSLAPTDPGGVDLYDARELGGIPQPNPTAVCEGEACQGPLAPPQETTPSSSTYEGPGNLKPQAKKHHKKKHHKKNHHKKKHQAKRGMKRGHSSSSKASSGHDRRSSR
jgi:hypothetical protein